MTVSSWIRKNFTSLCAFFISITLAIAAYGKWFYPIDILQGWEKGIAVIEGCIIISIWVFRLRSLLWLILTLLFACWGGYALFWYTLKLPCSCMGSLLHIPTLMVIGLDFLFVFLSAVAAYYCKARKQRLYLALILIIPCMIAGFYTGSFIYTFWVSPA